MNNEEITMKFGERLASMCRRGVIFCESLRELTDHIDIMINSIIKDYPEIYDTSIHIPDSNCVWVRVTFIDGDKLTLSLPIQTCYTVASGNYSII